MKRQHLVFCTDGIYPHAIGGMQRHSALLLEELARINTLDITVIHPHKEKVFDNSLGIKEISLNYTSGKNYLKSCYDYSKLVYHEIKKLNPDVIYSQGFSVWYGIRKIGSKVIVNPHGLEPFQTLEFIDTLKTAPMRILERYQFKYSAKVISLGGKLTEILSANVPSPRRKIVVIPNAVNLIDQQKRNFEKNTLQLLFVGRFAFNKGINILMQAISDLNTEGYKDLLHFNIVGKGPLYEEYIQKYDYANVTFVGFADDATLAQQYRDNDLFVFPTLFEGMPTVVLEAMVTGMPIVVTDTGATRELVDSSNGYVVEVNNVRAIKWAIQSFYQLSSDQRMQLSNASYNKVKDQFTWKHVAQKHLELFESFKTA